jgi:GTP-binding protein Era
VNNELKNRSGFVNILGIPNSGKSTLINKLVGKKISIVSHKVQTTRFCIKGIMFNHKLYSLILLAFLMLREDWIKRWFLQLILS